MNLEELKNTAIWDLYEKGLMFMNLRRIFSDVDLCHRMYNGDQWAGLKISENIEKVQYNFIKQIVKQKISTITSNLFAINYSPENIENREFSDVAQKTCDLLNRKASKVFDIDFMDKKIKKWVREAAITGESICYIYFNDQTNNPVNEIISKTDILYGDENEDDIQSQPYILIRQRKSLSEVIKYARRYDVSEEDIKKIIPDNETSTIAGEQGKNEINNKVWLITKFYKDSDDIVHFSQSTKHCDIRQDASMGIKLYPIAHLNWEDVEGDARGIGEVKYLIPNQLEVNKTALRRSITIKNTAYQQKVVNKDAITNPKDINKVGATLYFKDMGGTKASEVVQNTVPAQMSPDSEKFQNELISITKDLSNVSDATSGTINPESASGKAILAVQQAQNQPLNDQLIALKSFVEDIARIWFALWKTFTKNNLVINYDEKDYNTGKLIPVREEVPSYILEELETSVKVDITPKGAFDKYAQELSLENLYTAGKIEFDEYVESLDSDSVMPKTKLEAILKRRQEKQNQINAINAEAQDLKNQLMSQQADMQDIQSIGQEGYNLINQAMGEQAT